MKGPVEGWRIRWLRAFVLAVAMAVLCWPLTPASGVASALLGGLVGSLAGDDLARRRLRTTSALVLAGVALALGVALARLLVGGTLPAALLGPVPTLWLSEAVLWFSLALPVVFALRLLAARHPTAAVLEVAAVAVSLALAFAAHRDGMVHRPLALGDWAWTRGFDPVVLLLALGAGGVLILAGLLVRERHRRRLPLHFAALVLVGLLFLLLVQVEGVPKPQPAGELGLTGEPETGEGDEETGAGSGSGGRPELGELRFKDEYDSSGAEAPVAVAVLHDDYSPPSGVYYFRQSVFSQYNGRRLVQATRDDVDRDVLRRFPTRDHPVPGAPPASEERRPLEVTVGLLVDHVKPFALDSPVLFRPTRNPNPLHFQRAFEALSHVPVQPYETMLGRRSGAASWSEGEWRHYTEAPVDPRYLEMAEEMVAVLRPEYAESPLGKALAVKAYLDRNGVYSLKSRHAGAGDPTASFLFGDLTGYCVHFAHASAYLLRSLGVPVRVAAGYAVPEGSRGGGSTLLIRGANAHAWPEIYLDGLGWVVVDLAPERSLDDPLQAPDQGLQRMLGEMMRERSGERESFEEQLARALPWSRWMRLAALALAALAVAGYLVKLHRQLVPRWSRAAALPRVAYRAALDLLAEAGLRRGYGESRESFASRVAPRVPSFRRLTESHLGWALGSRSLAAAGDLRRLHLEAVAEIRHSLPLWRRLLGALDPFSWLRVH